jgi:galactitol-specific phosphotransferase system IIB component
MKLVLVACGTALATSTVVAKKIEQIAQENGIKNYIRMRLCVPVNWKGISISR